MEPISRITKDDTFLRLGEVQRITGLSKSTTYRLIAKGEHPPPLHIGSRSVWVEREIFDWLNALIEKRNERIV